MTDKALLAQAYDAATALADAFEEQIGSRTEERLRLVDDRVRTFSRLREELKKQGASEEELESLVELLPFKLRDHFSSH